MSWTPHINSLCIAKQINYWDSNAEHFITNDCPPHLKEHAYKLIVLLSIEYCSSIWDPHQQTLIQKLEMMQHHVAHFALNRPWRRNCRDSITNMLLTLKWLSLVQKAVTSVQIH